MYHNRIGLSAHGARSGPGAEAFDRVLTEVRCSVGCVEVPADGQTLGELTTGPASVGTAGAVAWKMTLGREHGPRSRRRDGLEWR